MKTAFTAGTQVRFNIPDGALAVITDYRKDSFWRIPGYLGDGFYLIEVIPEQRRVIAHEDDLILASQFRNVSAMELQPDDAPSKWKHLKSFASFEQALMACDPFANPYHRSEATL